MKKLSNVEILLDEAIKKNREAQREKERKIDQLKGNIVKYEKEIKFLETRKQAIDLKIASLREMQEFEMKVIARLEIDL